MKYRFTIDDIIRQYSITEAQLMEYVRLGRLIPESWENKDEKARRLAIADRSLVFTRDRLDVFFSMILVENLRYFQILETLDAQSFKIDQLSEQIARVDEMFVQSNTQMSLMAFAKVTGYKISYLRKSIKRVSDFAGILKVAGFSLPIIKQGKSWTLNYLDYSTQRKKLSYEILKQFTDEVNGRTVH